MPKLNPTIAIIKSTNEDQERHHGIDKINWNENALTDSKLKEDIEEFVQFTKINTIYELFSLIDNVINPSDKYVLNIEDLYYTSDYVYQAIFKSVAKDTEYSYNSMIEDSNKLATQLLGERHIVDGNIILIKRCIVNKDLDYVDITFDDITNILRSQFLHKAVIIKPDNTISEQNYVFSPFEINFDQSHIDNCRYHETKLLDFRLFFHVDINAPQTPDNFNKIASTIYNNKIYGNVLISLVDNSDSSPMTLDLTRDLINNIYILSVYNRLYNTEINKKKYARQVEFNNRNFEDYNPNIHKTFEHNNFPEITLYPNFLQIIKEEYNNIKSFDINNIDIKSLINNNSILNNIK